MRWLTLYARSRQVPASVVAALLGAAAVWSLSDSTRPDPRLMSLVLTVIVAATSIGLSGQDLRLDRTAAIRWLPRRALHVLLTGLLAGAVLWALADDAVEFAVRDSAGLMGLAALGAAAFGGQFAWTLPFGWFSIALFVPPADGVPVQVASWMLAPPGTAAATWTAVVLATAGTAAYAVGGPRR